MSVDVELNYVLKKVEQGIKSVRSISSDNSFSVQVGCLRFIFDGMIQDLQYYSDHSIKSFEETIKSVEKTGDKG